MTSKNNGDYSNVPRRTFLKVTGALGAAAAAASATATITRQARAAKYTEKDPDPVETPASVIYSTCQMCHARCGIRARIVNGVLVKLDGNPYHPNTLHMDERPNYSDAPASDGIFKKPGRLCPRGQAGIQTVYDPYRITQPLKRVGARGSGNWEAISWATAFAEIAAKINALIPVADRWSKLIIPGESKGGPIANALGFAPGRSIEKEMSERVWKFGFGTNNYGLSHTSICETSRHLANEIITWDHAKAKSSVSPSGAGGGKNKFGAGRTEGWQADIAGSKYVVLWGSNLAEAGFPMQYGARNVARMKEKGAKLVVIDPRFSNSAAKADWWIPVKPGGDQSLALGVLRVILDAGKQDSAYLVNANKAAANADNHTTWTDATYLVGKFTDSSSKEYWRYLTAADFSATSGVSKADLVYLTWTGSAIAAVESAALEGTLEPALADQTLTAGPDSGLTVTVRTAFELFKAGVMKHSLATYAGDAGITAADIQKLATELTAGTTADYRSRSIASYRGPAQHTNGSYAQFAIQHINTLLGNYDWKGGQMKGGGGYDHKSAVIKLDKVVGGPVATGIAIDRHGKLYEPGDAGSLFTGYPAQRPWGPFWTHTNYQEVIPSIADGYPYTMKVMFTYWNAWPYATPGLKNVFEELLSDESKIELFVSISPVMGEVPAWADYILPDSTYLEKFGIPGIPWNASGGTAIQIPVVGDIGDASTNTWAPISSGIDPTKKNDYRPVLPNTKTVLDIQIGLAKALGLDGTVSSSNGPVKCVGTGALVDGAGVVKGDLNNAWDWFNAILDNLASTSGKSVAEILSKGGVFWDKNAEYKDGPLATTGTHLSGQYGNIIRMFADPWARTRDSITGEYLHGSPERTLPAFHDGTPIDQVDAAWPYRLITYKTVDHGQARTALNPWLMLRVPENSVDISSSDAKTLGIRTGDKVRVSSASNVQGIVGKAKVTEGIRPGVVGISHSYGHWELGSKPHFVKDSTGKWTKVVGDPSRGSGINSNRLSRLDTVNVNTTLQDSVGGSASFYDTRVSVEKVL